MSMSPLVRRTAIVAGLALVAAAVVGWIAGGGRWPSAQDVRDFIRAETGVGQPAVRYPPPPP